MASFVFSIVTTFQIWACHMTCVYKLSTNFISQDILLNFIIIYPEHVCLIDRQSQLKSNRSGL